MATLLRPILPAILISTSALADGQIIFEFTNSNGNLDFLDAGNWTTTSGRTPDPANILIDESYSSTFAMTAAGDIALNGSIEVDPGGSFTMTDGTLSGPGLIDGSLTLAADAGGEPAIAPGLLSLTVTGDLITIGDDPARATYHVVLDGADCSHLHVTGEFDTIDMVIDCSTPSGLAGLTEDVYVIASYGTLNNGVDPFIGLRLKNGPGYELDTAYDDGVSTNNIALVRNRSLELSGPPTVTISEAPESGLGSSFLIEFSEPVFGFELEDLQISTTGTLSNLSFDLFEGAVVSGFSSLYILTVIDGEGLGDLSITLPAGTVTDLEGNPSTAAATATIGPIDFESPTITSIDFVEVLPGTDTYRFELTYSEPMGEGTLGEFQSEVLHNGTNSTAASGINGGAGYTTSFLDVLGVSGDGSFRLRIRPNPSIGNYGGIRDLAGNRLVGIYESAPVVVDTDNMPTLLSIVPDTTTPAAGAPVTFTFTFSEPVQGFDFGNLQINPAPGTGYVQWEHASQSQTGPATYEGVVYLWRDPAQPPGDIVPTLGGIITDLAGNPVDLSASSPPITIQPWDTDRDWNVTGPADFFDSANWDPTNTPDALNEAAYIRNAGTAVVDGSNGGSPDTLEVREIIVGTQTGSGDLTIRNLSKLRVYDWLTVADDDPSSGAAPWAIDGSLLIEGVQETDIFELTVGTAMFDVNGSATANATIRQCTNFIADQFYISNPLPFLFPTQQIDLTQHTTALVEDITSLQCEIALVIGGGSAWDMTSSQPTFDVTFRNISNLEVGGNFAVAPSSTSGTGPDAGHVENDGTVRLENVNLETTGTGEFQFSYALVREDSSVISDVAFEVVDSHVSHGPPGVGETFRLGLLRGGSTNTATSITADMTLDGSSLEAPSISMNEVQDATAGTLSSSLTLRNGSHVSTGSMNVHTGGVLNFEIGGLTRATQETAGDTGTYPAIDAITPGVTGTFTNNGSISVSVTGDLPPGTHTFDLITTQGSPTFGPVSVELPEDLAHVSTDIAIGISTSTLQVTIFSPPAGYSLWAITRGLTPGVNDGVLDDANGNGMPNAFHYLTDTDPLGSSFNAESKVRYAFVTDPVSGESHFSVTFPMTNGAILTGGNSKSGLIMIEGNPVVFSVSADSNLASPVDDLEVEEVTPAAADGMPPLTGDFDGLSGPDWEYRTFRLAMPKSALPKGFMYFEAGTP
ncbi:hypothetical protein HAHE_03090 [Haloferula helveola]|uniref:SbsA Ig-like domain-containing protein n=1 Tax=Haloferula helveola TaxID=490095 RepID=A0ABN6GYT8_9BACT|nr:hypothetical protein HAHE_03090 [Haloferula helveola]